MAVAGSAVGLGNFLRFPGLAAQYGGGAFMLAYAISFLIIGLPIGWAEWAMGRHAGTRGYHSAPAAFAIILRRPWAKYAGIIAVIVPVVIYLYYVFIESWCLGYAVKFWLGEVHLTTPADTEAMFKTMSGQAFDGAALAFSWDVALPWLLIVTALNFYLIIRGLSGGIEKMCNYGMPALILLALVVLARVLTLGAPDPARPHDSVANGLGYLWNPTKVQIVAMSASSPPQDVVGTAALAEARQEVAASHGVLKMQAVTPWRQLLNPALWLAAAGQICFSLAVGFGIIIVYASYLGEKDDVVLSGLTAASANEFCEVALGGLITVPAAVAFLGLASVAGQGTFGLGFTVLPLVFAKMPFGAFFGGAFFFMLFLAAITSSIAMLQPGVVFLEEALGSGKGTAVTLLAALTTVGCGVVVYFTGGQMKALDTLDFWAGTLLIFILATLQILIFSGYWGVKRGFDELHLGAAMRVPFIFQMVMRWVSPVFMLLIFCLWVLKEIFGFDLATFQAGGISGYVRDLAGPQASAPARLCVGMIFLIALVFTCLTARSKVFKRAERGLQQTKTPHLP